MHRLPFISIIIPTRKINNYLLKENLPALDQMNYEDFETIVLPNSLSNNDKTLEKKYRWLRLIPTNQVTRPAEKRNLGVKKAKGEIIAFIDDDAYPSKDWLTRAIANFQHREVKVLSISAVCGPGILPKKTNFWEKVFDEILKSWIGSGGYSYRFIQQQKRFVDDYPSMNFLVKKSIFQKLGGFNGNYWPGEDSKLCEDIVYKENGKILYDPKVLVFHHRRDNLIGFLKQHSNYGFHRGAFFAHGDQNSRRLSYLIPSFFVIYLVFVLLLTINNQQLTIYLPLFSYLILLITLFFSSLINTKNLLIALISPFVLFFTHLTYGIMFIKGFIIGLIKKERIYNEKN